MEETEGCPHAWALFDRLVELSAGDRQAVLEREAQDPALRREVKALLSEFERMGEEAECAPPEQILAAGTVLDKWQVEALIGRGGMGEVYLVSRIGGDFEQRAALKLLSRMDSAEERARFAAERRILARLEHPGVARLLDGGEHEGMPYAVMEYVEGASITSHARELSLRQQILLLLQACAAVEHAHRHLVVHRDLKPGNMLVDTQGRLRLLDFGIAKRLAPDRTGGDGATQVIRASPDYCAPEQLSGEPVSTATDVYALGVIAFELLTGERPWKLGGLPIIRAMDRLRTQEPPRPSARLAGARRRLVAGDLDSIVLKALQTRPERRYATMGALADDLRAWLDGRPVKAREGTWGYLALRALQRHKLAAGLGAAVLLSLTAGLAATAWQAREAALERDMARREAARNLAVSDYLSLMFRTAGELEGTADVTARMVLDRAAERLHEEFSDSPESYADLSLALAELYLQLNDYAGARPLLTRLLEQPGLPPGQRAMAQHDLAQLRFRDEHQADAASLLREAQAFWATDPGRYRDQLLDSRLLQSQIEFADGQAEQALLTLTDALPERVELSGAGHRDTAVLVNNIGNAYFRLGRFEEAITHFQRADAIWRALGRSRSTDALNTLNNWAGAEYRLGRIEQAVGLFERALELRRELYGPSAAMAALLNNLGKALLQLQRHDEAIGLLREAIRMGREHAGGDTSTVVLSAGMGLVDALVLAGDPAQARSELTWLEPAVHESRGPEHLLAGMLGISQARLLHAEGRTGEARERLASTRAHLESLGAPATGALAQVAELEASIL
ncbi:protein kinase domain-containing protein [Luteimonas dalianensis]|uniref:protein kinase domain-containing protein n=1 Tax=Luteimonas dalianensis TaxID=1148196 RepID=UPI003BF1CFBB